MHSTLSKISILFICLASLVSACSQATPPSPTQEPPSPTSTRRPTLTASLIPTQTAIPTLTVTPEPSATVTLTNTPVSELNDAKFYTSGFLPGFRYFITLQGTKDLKGKYEMIVHEDKTFTCENNSQYPKRLYCVGRLPRIDDWVNYQVIDQSSKQTVFSGKVFIPLVIPP
jgi:hypothetical protein